MNHDTGYRTWGEYRERNLATILGVPIRYINPATQEFAQPHSPSDYERDQWQNHPMRGVGL